MARPKRSYRAVIESLRQVWKITEVAEAEALWRLGTPEWPTLDAGRIRLAVWNLCKGAGGILFEHDFRSLFYRSDLILTQEALMSRRSLKIMLERGLEAMHAASYVRGDGLRDGVMTLSRAGLQGESARILCKYPEPVFRTPKVALVNFFDLTDHHERLMVINLHATLIRSIKGAREEMEHLVERLPEHSGPALLAGDFNTFTPGYLRIINDVLGGIGFRHIPVPEDPRPTTGALDQIFIRGLKADNLRVDTTIRNSDHFPLMVDLSVLR